MHDKVMALLFSSIYKDKLCKVFINIKSFNFNKTFTTKPCINILPRAISHTLLINQQRRLADKYFATQKLNQFTHIESLTRNNFVYLKKNRLHDIEHRKMVEAMFPQLTRHSVLCLKKEQFRIKTNRTTHGCLQGQ